jgi:hypothetical protein
MYNEELNNLYSEPSMVRQVDQNRDGNGTCKLKEQLS